MTHYNNLLFDRKTKIYLSLGLIIFFAFLFIVHILFSPRPIISNTGHYQIRSVIYNPGFNGETANQELQITSYDEKALLNCLSHYSEKLTLANSNGYSTNDIEFEILISSENGSKFIFLGNENYSCKAYGDAKNQILDSNLLISELENLLLLPQNFS